MSKMFRGGHGVVCAHKAQSSIYWTAIYIYRKHDKLVLGWIHNPDCCPHTSLRPRVESAKKQEGTNKHSTDVKNKQTNNAEKKGITKMTEENAVLNNGI